MVGVAEDGSKDGERGGVVEDCAKSDGRGLDGREVYCGALSVMWIFVLDLR